jgi:hypothetical protein
MALCRWPDEPVRLDDEEDDEVEALLLPLRAAEGGADDVRVIIFSQL